MNIYAIITLIATAIIVGYGLFCKKKLENVQAWLLGAVTLAEKELGGGTRKLKLANAYNQFVTTFPRVAAWLPFSVFSDMVDASLVEMRRMLESNEKAKAFVEGCES